MIGFLLLFLLCPLFFCMKNDPETTATSQIPSASSKRSVKSVRSQTTQKEKKEDAREPDTNQWPSECLGNGPLSDVLIERKSKKSPKKTGAEQESTDVTTAQLGKTTESRSHTPTTQTPTVKTPNTSTPVKARSEATAVTAVDGKTLAKTPMVEKNAKTTTKTPMIEKNLKTATAPMTWNRNGKHRKTQLPYNASEQQLTRTASCQQLATAESKHFARLRNDVTQNDTNVEEEILRTCDVGNDMSRFVATKMNVAV